ncbi:hypothetical protein HanXRQr2_Chr03g0097051 [Helianthus annuus]|uniref:Uncharacterized protein n=1 Tax=Helianthus annuus TaxID=4232 RepID=A0A9K3JE02_HELAN|nr:hypothetical protein HanXRQr2_Chr03g0097051 [Helianthus annuus]KAJ0599524.1 hypothetical protein HanIR_Chr03g0105851 [Helianthus annuus]KAJ0942570.1 hypothetical protein HanPSC8_Chr03g0093571 [Helianthus annuus]
MVLRSHTKLTTLPQSQGVTPYRPIPKASKVGIEWVPKMFQFGKLGTSTR